MGPTWERAAEIFLDRRSKLAALIGEENEDKFLLEGTFESISNEPSREPEISVKGSSGEDLSYQLPDQTGSQIHRTDCKKPKLSSLIDWYRPYRSPMDPSPETIDFAFQLSENEALQKIISLHGGFWYWILRQISSTEYMRNGGKSSLIHGSFELTHIDATIYERMASANVSPYEAIALFIDEMDDCPCIGVQECFFCEKDFIPSAWAYAELKLGRRVCSLCASIAADGRQNFLWSYLGQDTISSEIDFGLSMQEQLHKSGHLDFLGAPQRDSADAFSKLRLHSLQNDDFIKGFLTIAMRPKESQVRTVHGYWEQWLSRYNGLNEKALYGDDGHACNSLGEQTICNFLHAKKIEHVREPKYSDLANRDDEALVRYFKGDFRVKDVIFEYAGMEGIKDYDQNLAAKLSVAKDLSLEVVVIRPSDLSRLPDFFG